MDAKYASGMNVSYLKSFEKKYSLDFEVSGYSHDLPLYLKSIWRHETAVNWIVLSDELMMENPPIDDINQRSKLNTFSQSEKEPFSKWSLKNDHIPIDAQNLL